VRHLSTYRAAIKAAAEKRLATGTIAGALRNCSGAGNSLRRRPVRHPAPDDGRPSSHSPIRFRPMPMSSFTMTARHDRLPSVGDGAGHSQLMMPFIIADEMEADWALPCGAGVGDEKIRVTNTDGSTSIRLFLTKCELAPRRVRCSMTRPRNWGVSGGVRPPASGARTHRANARLRRWCRRDVEDAGPCPREDQGSG
jgi:hypothetical protein